MNGFKKELLALYLIQISNFIIPLVTIPYLTHVLGINDFGKVGYFNAIVFFMAIIIDFGFGLSGAKSIATCEKAGISIIYTNIQFVKIILFLFVNALLYIGFIYILNFDFPYYLVFLSTLSIVFTPSWLFVGLSNNSKFSILTLLSKILLVIFTFSFVKDGDYLKSIEIYTLSSIFLSIIVMIYIIFGLKIKFIIKSIDRKVMLIETQKSLDIFIASFFSLGYTYLTPILLKNMVGDSAVGIYTILDKLISVMRQIYIPINLVLYAKICQLYDKKKFAELNSILIKVSIVFCLIGGGALFANIFLGEYIINYVFPQISIQLRELLYIAILTQIIVSFAIILVNFIILPSGNSAILKKIYAVGFFSYMLALFLFRGVLDLSFFLYLILFTELFLTILFFIFIKKNNLLKM